MVIHASDGRTCIVFLHCIRLIYSTVCIACFFPVNFDYLLSFIFRIAGWFKRKVSTTFFKINLLTPVPPVTARDKPWSWFYCGVITFDQNWHHLCSTSAGGKDLSNDTQIGVIGSSIKVLRNLSENLKAKFPAARCGYSMAKFALLDDAFSKVFEREASPVEGQSLQQKDNRRKRKAPTKCRLAIMWQIPFWADWS